MVFSCGEESMIMTQDGAPFPRGAHRLSPRRRRPRSFVRALRFTRLAAISMLGVIALLVNSAIAFYALNGVRASDRIVEQSNSIRAHIHQLQIVMTDAETGQRGFIITGDEGYLQPYRNSRSRAEQFLQQLTFETRGEVEQAQYLAQLRILTDAKLTELERTI